MSTSGVIGLQRKPGCARRAITILAKNTAGSSTAGPDESTSSTQRQPRRNFRPASRRGLFPWSPRTAWCCFVDGRAGPPLPQKPRILAAQTLRGRNLPGFHPGPSPRFWTGPDARNRRGHRRLATKLFSTLDRPSEQQIRVFPRSCRRPGLAPREPGPGEALQPPEDGGHAGQPKKPRSALPTSHQARLSPPPPRSTKPDRTLKAAMSTKPPTRPLFFLARSRSAGIYTAHGSQARQPQCLGSSHEPALESRGVEITEPPSSLTEARLSALQAPTWRAPVTIAAIPPGIPRPSMNRRHLAD